MSKEDIINYVMNSPSNTNPNVLGTMLDSLGGGVEIVNAEAELVNPVTSEWNCNGDKTYEELLALQESGKAIIVRLSVSMFGSTTKRDFLMQVVNDAEIIGCFVSLSPEKYLVCEKLVINSSVGYIYSSTGMQLS